MFGLRHLASLLLCLLLSLGVTHASAQDAGPSPWTREIDALVAGDATNPPPQDGVVFVGSSSIRLWTTLAQDFPGASVINRGFGGSRIADSTRHADRLVVQYHPKLVVFYAGDNDIAEGRTATQVLTDFQAFVDRLRRDLPHVTIAFVSIKPSVARFALWPTMRAANEGVAAWAKSRHDVVYVDVASRMLDAEGKPRPELLLPDGLHMRPAGYAIWVDALTPWVRKYGYGLHKRH
jgi:lysophospholipase L1-like esterase